MQSLILFPLMIQVGVCFTGGGDGTDPYAEVSLHPLPEYTVPSDGVTMTCITCTSKGHIFFSGRDGHVYEIQHTTGCGWQRCRRKVCLTSGLGSLLSRWVVPHVFKFEAVDPIVDMIVDNERHILSARTEDPKLQVLDLGVNGDGPLKKVAEDKNLTNQRDSHYRGRQSVGSRPASRATKSSIVCITPLSTDELKCLHLVVVLSDGRRLHISTASSSGSGGLGGISSSHHRPHCIKVVMTRPPPPLGVGGCVTFGALSIAGWSQTEELSLKIEAAFYSAGTAFLSGSSLPTISSLLIVKQDAGTQSSPSVGFEMSGRSSRALQESVSTLLVEGHVADVSPMPEITVTVQSLYSDLKSRGFEGIGELCERAFGKLWAHGDLVIQHMLPRRKIVVFSTKGMMEVVFNRPVDILLRMLESSTPRSILENFFNCFGPGEAASMCLMVAAKVVHTENLISNPVDEKAAEAFEDPRLVGMPQLESSSSLTTARTPPGGFSMGQIVQEPEPIFSSAHEGLCVCSSRLLFPVWELPFIILQVGIGSSDVFEDGVIVYRLSVEAMQILERKICSLEQFLCCGINQRRGLYGYVAGLGDIIGSVLYGTSSDIGVGDWSMIKNFFGAYTQNVESSDGRLSNKRQRLAYSPAELAAVEVRAMECSRQLLLGSGEALFLLQLLTQHHLTRLTKGFDASLKQRLIQLTFHQLVCSEEGDQFATRLISGLMEYYMGPDGRGILDDISRRCEGCPSYYKEADYKFYIAVEFLERVSICSDAEDNENLAREAFEFLTKIPDAADLRTICKRFEDLRFYEAVVWLPLQKAQALDPSGDALQLNEGIPERALSKRRQCYDIITSALCSLKGETGSREFGSSTQHMIKRSVLDQASCKRYIRQIVQLGVQSPDRVFHEYLYRTMIDLGLENELLEYEDPELVPFLQNACCQPIQEVRAVSAVTSMPSPVDHSTGYDSKYSEFLARYHVMKRQHLPAAHLPLRLAESCYTGSGDAPTLEKRLQKEEAHNFRTVKSEVGQPEKVVCHGTIICYIICDHGILLACDSRSTIQKLKKNGLKKDKFIWYLDSDINDEYLELVLRDKKIVGIIGSGNKTRIIRLWKVLRELAETSNDIDELAAKTNILLKVDMPSGNEKEKQCELFMAGYSVCKKAYIVHYLGDAYEAEAHTRPHMSYDEALEWLTRSLIHATYDDPCCGGILKGIGKSER